MSIRCVLLTTLSFVICVSSERWSRQITNTGAVNPEEINDWVPLAHPNNNNNDRTKIARVLTFPDNHFLQALFNSNPPAPAPPPPLTSSLQQQQQQQQQQSIQQHQSSHLQQTSIATPGQFQQRYVLPSNEQINQNNVGSLHNHNLKPQPPTSQSFFKFEMPTFNKDGTKPNNLPTVQTGYQIQHSFPHQAVVASPLFSQKPVFPTDFYPQFQPLVNQKVLQQNVIEDTKRPSKEKIQEIKSTKLPEISTPQPPTPFPSNTNFQVQRPTSFQAKYPFHPQGQLAIPTTQDEEVQLLYVPYDTLYHQRHEPFTLDNKFSAVPPPISPSQINNFYTSEPLTNHDQNLFNPTPSTTTSTTFKPSTTFNAFLNPRFTSPKPKPKLKPHQPPLAMFALTNDRPQSTPINDVLRSLVNAKSINVLDAPAQSAPPVFIGPAGLPTPHGYTKFELPYLSSIDRNHLENHLQELPFFVAPLSYKAPSGFNKIILPEPHVGSVIVNKPFPVADTNIVQQELRTSTHRPIQPNKQVYITPVDDSRYRSTTPRITASTPARYRHQFTGEVQTSTNGYYNNEQFRDIHSITSPRPPVRTQTVNSNRPYFQKRPEERYQNQNSAAQQYSNFRPMFNHVVNEEYFKVSPLTSSSTSTTTTTTTTTTTEQPKQHLTESIPQSQTVEIETIRSNQIFSDVSSPRPEIIHQRYSATTSQYSAPNNEEEYRMKSYFREQEAFRNRPHAQSSATNGDTVYESIQYTPVSLDYDHQKLHSIPSSTPTYFEGSTLRTTTPKERITFYTPTPQNQEVENIKRPDEPVQYTHDDSNHSTRTENPIRTTTAYHRYHQTHEQIRDNNVPSNHRPTYSNEVTYNHDLKTQEEEQEPEYEPNPYKLPTELPPLTPNLPGLVNALIEKDRLNAIEKENSTTENPTTTPLISYQPTKRPIHRSKKPTVKVSSSTSVSYSSSSSSDTSRRPINRNRRPYNPRNNGQTTASSATSSSTILTTTTRNPTVRNPNRNRYNPTPEERRRYRPRIRTNLPTTSSKGNKYEEDNIEYQRDVLKQNYPVFKSSSKKSTAATTTTSTERVTEPQPVVTVTPSNEKDKFASLLEPMQIAHEYQQSPNYGPGYFPNAEDTSPTEPIEVEKNEIHPVYTAITTTTEQTKETTRRPVFVRRPARPIKTTTEGPQTTTIIPEERYTVRPRVRPEISQRPRVVKIRGRIRKPHPASTTTAEPETKSHDFGYQELSRFNQDFFQDDRANRVSEKSQHKSNFNLDTQESKWSPSLSHANSFRPLDPEDKAKFLKDNKQFEIEPEIVTAGPQSDSSELKNDQNTYLFNVSAGFGSSGSSYGLKTKLKHENKNSKSSDTTLDDLIDESIIDSDHEKNDDNEQKIFSTKNQLKKYQNIETRRNRNNEDKSAPIKSTASSHRRGVWRRVRVNSGDSFETAESQNLGSQIYNSLFFNNNNNNNQRNKYMDEKISNNNNFNHDTPTSTELTGSNENESNYFEDRTSNENNENDSSEMTTIIPNDFNSETDKSIIQKQSENHKMELQDATTESPSSSSFSASSIILKDSTTQITPKNIIKHAPGTAAIPAFTFNSKYNQNNEEIDSTTIDNLYDYNFSETVTESINNNDDDNNDKHDLDNINKNENNHKKTENDDEDLDSQPSLFDEVRKKLTNLFAIDDNDNNDDDDLSLIKSNFKPRKHEYTNIQRIRAVTDNPENNQNSNADNNDKTNDNENINKNIKTNTNNSDDRRYKSKSIENSFLTTTTTKISPFHKNLMKNIVYATSTSTEISHETEICYRGRCVKAAKQL